MTNVIDPGWKISIEMSNDGDTMRTMDLFNNPNDTVTKVINNWTERGI